MYFNELLVSQKASLISGHHPSCRGSQHAGLREGDQQGSLKADAVSNTFLDKADESWRLGSLKKKVGVWKDQCVKRRKWSLKKRGLALGQGPFAFQVVGAMLAGDGSENRHRDRWLGGWGSWGLGLLLTSVYI